MSNANDRSRVRMIEAAKRYAAADRTDPFTFRRAVTHIENGVASATRGENNRDYDMQSNGSAFYDATQRSETKTVTGFGGVAIDAVVLTYSSLVRP